MFKKKPIYIVGIVIFTLLLIADLVLYFAVPTAGGRGNMPGMGGSFDADSFSGELPEGMDSESFGNQRPGGSKGELPEGMEGATMPEGMEDVTMPEDFDPSAMQGQFNVSDMPEGFDASNLPEDFDASNIPGGFDSSNISGRGEQSGMAAGSGLSALRRAFWPVLIICILGDAVCIFMLVRISKKKESLTQEPENDQDDDTPRRPDRGNTVLAVIAVLLVGAVIFSSLTGGGATSALAAQTEVLQAEAAVGDIVSTFSGSGTISSADAEPVELPEGIKIVSYSVRNGQSVEAGDEIAVVDKPSVLNAIYEVQTLINEMDKEIAEIQSDTLDTILTARADGRIKAIYVTEGDSVAAAMYEHGAVLLMSLGGSMTVQFTTDAELSVGQTLTVTLSDSSTVEGKVQQVRDGTVTVTTTDNGPTPDDTVSVATEDGTVLGTGTLSISSPLKVTGYFGTVASIKVEVGDKVAAGDTLLTLENTQDLARYQELLLQRQELTELVSTLNTIYRDGCITATQSGIVSQIGDDAVYVLPEEAAHESADTTAVSTDAVSTASAMSVKQARSSVYELPEAPSEDAQQPQEPTETSTSGVYAGKVRLVTYGALYITVSDTDMTGTDVSALASMPDAVFTSDGQYAPVLDVPVNLFTGDVSVPSTVSALRAGDKVLLYIEDGVVTQIDYIAGTGETQEEPSSGSQQTPEFTLPTESTESSGTVGTTQLPSSGGSFIGQQTENTDEEQAEYEVALTTFFAIIPAETVTVDVSVDELDILSLQIGQEAVVSLDALPGQSFTGSVKKINTSGTNEGGSTKYTVTMEVPRTEQMLDGMNASARIEVARLSSVLTVPAESVYEDGSRTYVYTAADEKTGEPIDPVDVTTGASDGSSIEILSGLEAGSTVYYSYADSIVYSFFG